MKSKAEILKAVDTCVHIDRSCSECPYCDDTKDCVNHLVADFRAILIKSDFEVLSEIIKRGTGYDFCCHSVPGLIAGIELGNPDERYMSPVKITFL